MSDRTANRRRTSIVAGASAAGAYALMLVVVLTTGYADLGYGSTGNYIVTGLIVATVVLVMVSLVSWARRWTSDGQITSWKRTGRFALAIWGAGVAFTLTVFAGAAVPAVAVLVGLLSGSVMAFVIPMVWFPIWTVIAAIRGALHPDQVAGEPLRPVPEGQAAPIDAAPSTREPSAVPAVGGVGDEPSHVTVDVAEPAHRSRRWSGRTIALAVAGVALMAGIAAGLYVGDQYLQVQRYSALMEQVDAAREIVAEGNRTDGKAIDKRDRASSANATSAQELMEDEVRANNVEVAVALGVVLRDLENVSVLPWHGGLVQMQTDALGYLDQWVQRSQGVARAADAEEMTASDRETEIARSTQWALLRQSAKDAVPSLFADDVMDQATEMFRFDTL